MLIMLQMIATLLTFTSHVLGASFSRVNAGNTYVSIRNEPICLVRARAVHVLCMHRFVGVQ